ncbi:MAG: LysR substrate-binding domain-containing protein [Thiomicrorhabdus chilensis]|uniref:hydrogen peroxide-inducible genes activator n=1 Tax=Thiomicrorhabdus chilensis TaxID=63656 RepID=UPI00299EF217|nr:LysR substrate-binding domain-containing protein [Thiomicrorhabdus chilensis]MDX1348045.1 LysR substrate-binding domain-containing protein [Thiomicrorhabdus chilensis]
MTLNELKYIIAVAKERHFRKASETCFVSQPTLSVAIKKLEEELGVILFERRKQDVLITPVGKKIIQIAEEIIERSQDIKQIAKTELGELTSELKIGAIHTIGPYLLPKLIPAFHQKVPNVPLIIEENYTHVLAEKLQTGELDMVILSLPFDEPNIETFELYEEPFKLIIPKQHPLNDSTQEIFLKKIENETILLLGAGHCFRDQVVEAFPNLMHLNYQSDRLQKTFEGSSLETIRYMVASGAGISIFPCSSLSERDEALFTVKELNPPVPTRKVALAWRKSFPRKEILERFKQSLLEIKLNCTIQTNSSKV